MQYEGNPVVGLTATIKYTAYGVRRVVKGEGGRSAARSGEISIPSKLPVLNTGVKYYRYKQYISEAVELKKTIKGSFSNPRHGIRLVVTVDD